MFYERMAASRGFLDRLHGPSYGTYPFWLVISVVEGQTAVNWADGPKWVSVFSAVSVGICQLQRRG